jgi:nitrate/nitrite transport system substrate-binding protein
MTLKLGFLALLDAAPLLVAKERGFFAEQGLEVELLRQSSWAALRDKLAAGSLDGAQMLAPMVLASKLGLGGFGEPLVTELALNIGGNSIALGGAAVKDRPLTFGIVHPFSAHHYEMRLWLESAGLEAKLMVVPPAQMLSHLSAGLIDGYCAGEPWGHLAARNGLGRVVATSRQICPGRIEKVFAVRQQWAVLNAGTHDALIRALECAGRWCDQPENRAELAELLSRPCYVNAPRPLLRVLLESEDRPVFTTRTPDFSWRDQSQWYLDQMRRWGQLPEEIEAIPSFAGERA